MIKISETFTDITCSSWSRFWIVLGDFLDSFRNDPEGFDESDCIMLSDTQMASFLSAVVETLVMDYSFSVPIWLLEDRFFLIDPFFPSKAKGDFRIFALVESPPAFKRRNVYVLANVLSRC